METYITYDISFKVDISLDW